MNKDYFLEKDGTYRSYGKELILDLHQCDVDAMSKESIEAFMEELCERIDMERVKLIFWDEDVDHLLPPEKVELEHITGVSAVQFISTSNITLHACTKLESVFLNIFSCKDFDEKVAAEFTIDFFDSQLHAEHCIERSSEGQLLE